MLIGEINVSPVDDGMKITIEEDENLVMIRNLETEELLLCLEEAELELLIEKLEIAKRVLSNLQFNKSMILKE